MRSLNTISPVRAPWNGFPEVAVHSSIYKLKNLPGYQGAKKGDNRAATRIAAALINPDRLNISIDYVVPVIQVDTGCYNAIPVAFAALLAKRLRARLWLDVFQIKKVNHTGADGINRLKHQPVFDGSTPNGTCIICDDVVTYGASLANLRGFLVAAGTKVIAATVIGAAYGSTKLAPDHILIQKLQRRYGPELERYTSPLGFRSECLTAREAYFLEGIRTLDRLRACFAQEIGSTDRSRGVRCRI